MPLFEGLGYGGEKTAVILDIGHAYTKAGFSAENGPRCIIPSEVKKPKTNKKVPVWATTDAEELYSLLVDFLHQLYFRHLLVNPKERRVLIVESVLCPTLFRNTLAKALFVHYEVPSVLFAPGHLVTLFTLGIPSALVLDAGYSETLVLPVYEGIPILKAWQAIPIAGQAVHSYLSARLLESATVRTETRQEKPLTAILETILPENIVEDIKVRCCFVTKMSRANEIQAAKQGKETDTEKLPPSPPGLEYPLDGGNILNIDGRLREEACEVLFEQDSEEKSIATLILDSILQCPRDMRRTLAENIILIGGTCMLPGFKPRILAELKALQEKPKYRDELAVKNLRFHKPPGQDNYIGWLGGAIFGALEVLATRSVTKETYQQNNVIPDWSVLTDPEDKEERSYHRR